MMKVAVKQRFGRVAFALLGVFLTGCAAFAGGTGGPTADGTGGGSRAGSSTIDATVPREDVTPEALARWQAALAAADSAFAADTAATRGARHGDRLFAAAVDPAHASEVPEAWREEALRQAAEAWAAADPALHRTQLHRLAMLSWHGLAPGSSPERTLALYERLAREGDEAAVNTVRLAHRNPALLQPPETSFLTGWSQTQPLRDFTGVCTSSQIDRAIGDQFGLYRNLMNRRGVPHAGFELALRVQSWRMPELIPGNWGVALYARDRLTSCVWLMTGDGVAFEAIHLPYGFIRERMDEFLAEERITGAAEQRAPALRSTRSTIVGAPRRTSRPAPGDPLPALALALFPGAVAELLSELDALVVVPTGHIGVVPFAALPLGTGGAVLLERMNVSIAPSLVDVFGHVFDDVMTRDIPGCPAGFNAQRTSGAVLRPLIVGDPDYSGDPDYLFPQLPGARAEALQVARRFGVRPLVGRHATVAAVLAGTPDADMLYFATHGLSYGGSGLDGFLALSDGGRLSARQIQGLCLPHVRVAVLSACQTGLGQTVGGGVIGVARAFQIAGVPDVVMSLWDVDDAVTASLMTAFAERLANGEDPVPALRTAMLATRAVHPEPRYWASFAVMSEKAAER